MGNGSITNCCKKPEIQIAAVAQHHVEFKKKVTPNGFGKLFAGARTSDGKHTCPIISLHTWKEARENISTHHGHLGLNEGSRGHNFSTQLTEAGKKEERKAERDEEIQIIPVEDVIKIHIATEIKKTVEQNKVVRFKTPPPEDLTCFGSVKKCCVTNVCCCCCPEKKVAPETVVTATEKATASRAIVVTIEHCSYSLVDTPSTVRVAESKKQQEFYQKYSAVETEKFYYLHNEEFDEQNYQKHLGESEAFSRTVMQLKAMIDNYPDPAQLQQIVAQNYVHVFGCLPSENTLLSPGTVRDSTAVSKITTNDL